MQYLLMTYVNENGWSKMTPGRAATGCGGLHGVRRGAEKGGGARRQ